MDKFQKQVKEFHERFNCDINNNPTIPDDKLRNLRMSLIEEEHQELNESMLNEDIIEVADALADLLYVIYGTALAYGIDIEPIFDEVHRSNMSKGDPKVIIREDGKILKAENYSPPNLKSIIYGDKE